MPGKRLKPCPQGSSCPYQNEGQHVSEFSHDERSDALATKEAKKKADAWKKSAGQQLGSDAGAGDRRSLGGSGVLGGRQLGRANARGSSRAAAAAAAAAAARRAERLGAGGGATAASQLPKGAALSRRSPAVRGGDTLLENVGCHCLNCNTLDFLPLRCQGCKNSFCQNCVGCDVHACPERHSLSKTVPVCPLCGQAVPVRAGEPPDVRVERHIADGCTTPKAITRPIFTHSCSVAGCSRKEAVPCACKYCALNFCFTHRQPDSHSCGGSMRITAATAAEDSKRKRLRICTSPAAKGSESSSDSSRGTSSTAASGGRGRGQPSVVDAFAAPLQQTRGSSKLKRSAASGSASGSGSAAAAAAAAPAPAPAPAWSCSVCTLRNSSGAQQCAVCGEERPAAGAGSFAQAACTSEVSAVIDLCDDVSD